MIKMLRSFFGLQEVSGTRKVVGQPLQVNVKDIHYIRNSNGRLTILQKLCTRYQGTPQAAKFKTIYDKTKRLHSYLVSKNRLHELELFHLQHTDHFISTYTTIVEVHQRHTSDILATPDPAPEPAITDNAGPPTPFPAKPRSTKQAKHEQYVTEMARRVRVQSQSQPQSAAGPTAEGAPFAVPTITIDKESNIVFAREYTPRESITKRIGFASTQAEKEGFLVHVSSRLGIDKQSLFYVGNATLALPARDGTNTAAAVPIINWIGFSYALHLNDYRLFPVHISSL